LALLALFLSPQLALAVASGGPAEGRPCVLCHPGRDVKAYELLYGAQGLEEGYEGAMEYICWSCHNGSVVDSRHKLTFGGQHPTGVRSPYTSKVFPNYEGRIQCGSCHTAHGTTTLAKRWLRGGDLINGVCTACHDGRSHYHNDKVVSEDSRNKVYARGGLLGKEGEVGCRSCHTPHGARGESLLLMPLAPEKEGGETICLICHADLAVTQKVDPPYEPCSDCHQLHGEEPFRGDDGRQCVDCHQNASGAGNHPVEGEQGCLGCHSIHNPVMPGGQPGSYLKTLNVGALLCAECHAGQMGRHGPASKMDEGVLQFVSDKGYKFNDDGALACATCHVMHASPYGKLLNKNQDTSCLYCHLAQNPFTVSGRMGGAHPVGVELNSSQEEQTIDDGAALSETRKVLSCGSCHSAHDALQKPVSSCVGCHEERKKVPLHGGDERGCLVCHKTHGDAPPASVCRECHGDVKRTDHTGAKTVSPGNYPLFDKVLRSGIEGEVYCPTCHDPHSTNRRMLREEKPSTLCLKCHQDKVGVLSGSHDGTKTDITNISSVTDETRDNCLPCHRPHREVSRIKDYSKGDVIEQFCRKCHGYGMSSSVKHSMGGVPPWQRETGDLPLFGIDGNRDPKGFISCPTCHTMHVPGSMRRESKNPPELCVSCHIEKVTILASDHSPISMGKAEVCTYCHKLHGEGGERPRVWELRVMGVGTWNDRKCMSVGCHIQESLEASPFHGVRSHPVNMGGKEEGFATLPHYDALGNVDGNLLTCSTCHNVHGQANGQGAGPGGIVEDFLRVPLEGGGLCGACHTDKMVVAATPHNLPGSEEGDLPFPCGPCHTAHNATMDDFLWGMTPGPAEFKPNMRCRSCHTAQKRSPDKPFLMQYHIQDGEEAYTERDTIFLQWPMVMVDSWFIRTGEDPVIPLFDREGELVPNGSLQCVSCHEPHVFNPAREFVYGAISPSNFSFLRLSDLRGLDYSVCADCHKDDLINHFNKYHMIWWDAGKEFHRETLIQEWESRDAQ